MSQVRSRSDQYTFISAEVLFSEQRKEEMLLSKYSWAPLLYTVGLVILKLLRANFLPVKLWRTVPSAATFVVWHHWLSRTKTYLLIGMNCDLFYSLQERLGQTCTRYSDAHFLSRWCRGMGTFPFSPRAMHALYMMNQRIHKFPSRYLSSLNSIGGLLSSLSNIKIGETRKCYTVRWPAWNRSRCLPLPT